MRETRREDQRRVTTVSTETCPRFGCYCEHKVVDVFCVAKCTELGFILSPWQFTVAQTLKLHKVISSTDDARLAV